MAYPTYDTLVEALQDLKQRGYAADFKLKPYCVLNEGEEYRPDQFTIKEVHRFEGMSNPADSSIIYAIETNSGCMGTLLHAYGTYAEDLDPEMVQALKYDPRIHH